MVSMKDRFKSTGLFKAADFEEISEDGIDLVIDHLELDVQVGSNYRDVVYFQNDGRGLALNQTTAHVIERLYGDSDDWPGRVVNLYLDRTVTFNDRPQPGVRVRAPKSGNVAPRPVDSTKPATVQHEKPAPFDDEIPF